MRYGHGLVPVPSKAGIMYKYKLNTKSYVVSRPVLKALSNGALGFPGS